MDIDGQKLKELLDEAAQRGPGGLMGVGAQKLKELLEEAAQRGAERAMYEGRLYTKQQACEQLGISYNTLQVRLRQRKIYAVDGRIPGTAIRAYLAGSDGRRDAARGVRAGKH